MPLHRAHLPQLTGHLFVTDGGLETTLMFHEGVDLPHSAAFPLLGKAQGRALLERYFRTYAGIARARGAGFILEAPTWRANAEWGAKLGHDAAALDSVNRAAIALLERIRREEAGGAPVVISGCIGPRGDGYQAGTPMSIAEATGFHTPQIATFAATEADMVTALTMTYPEEATGVARAASAAGIPAVLSFTVETDGRLPNGTPLGEAITTVDDATGGSVAYFMVNCAHPTHFRDVLERGESWVERIRGVRANASMKSHAELDLADTLDDGDPELLAAQYVELRQRLPRLNVLGGCCGTDQRHVGAICAAWANGDGSGR